MGSMGLVLRGGDVVFFTMVNSVIFLGCFGFILTMNNEGYNL